MPIAAVGFDLDDTLCTPEPDREALLAAAAEAAEAPPIDEWTSRAAYRAAHQDHQTNDTRAPVFEALLDDAEVTADPDALARAYRKRVNEALRPAVGLTRLLETLRERYRVGLLTNGPSRAQRSKLETLGLTDAFDAVRISGELTAGKPDPRAFEALLDGLGVSAGELVYVGDDVEADVGGAVGAGCRAIQVLHSDGPAPDPRAVAHVPFDGLADELPARLQTLD